MIISKNGKISANILNKMLDKNITIVAIDAAINLKMFIRYSLEFSLIRFKGLIKNFFLQVIQV